jgi:hypothetical protein
VRKKKMKTNEEKNKRTIRRDRVGREGIGMGEEDETKEE